MGFLDKIFKAFGFEDEGKATLQGEKKTEGASFDLKKFRTRTPSTRFASSQLQVQQILDELKEKGVVIIDLSGFNITDRVRALDFISGAIFALEGSIKKLEDEKYYCSLIDEEE